MSTRGYSQISDDSRVKPLPALTVFCYGVGHFLNDMTGACWFNYLLYYLITVRDFSTLNAALIMLSGQLSDAIFNPIVGYLSDKTKSKYGRRKTWVAIGAIIVSVTFYFVFSGCGKCQRFFRSEGTVWDVLYGAFLTGSFNVGWAAIQVSHLSFAPDITSVESERVRLYSARSAATIFASFCVLIIAGISFRIYGITEDAFWLLSLAVIIIGDIFTIIFLIGVPEQELSHHEYVAINENTGEREEGKKWSGWMKTPLFWQVGIIYTLTRVAINMSQIFMPFYIELFLGFGSGSEVIAIVPIVVMATGFITSFLLKKINTKFGRRTSYFIGSVCFLLGILVIFLLPQKSSNIGVFHPWWLIYLVAFLFGIGQTTVLVTAISMEADLVGNDVKNSAFVYGFISCMEKFGTGTVIMSTSQYTKDLLTVRLVEIVVPFGALVVSGIVLLTIVKYWRKQ